MDVVKSISHLARKIGSNKFSTDYDRRCVNDLIDYVTETQKENVQTNILFFKLYVYLYGQLIKKYEENAFDKHPQRELHKILDLPVWNIVQEFVDAINVTELYRAYKDGEPEHDPKTWEHEETYQNLILQANKALNAYK